MKVKLAEVMSSPPVSIFVGAPFRDVVKLLHGRRIRHLPVVDSGQQVVGIISQRDLYKIQPPHKNEDGIWVYDLDVMDEFILQNIMIPDPFVLTRENTLAEAIGPMVRNKYGCVPVIDHEKKLCGIITQFDILKIAYQILEEGQ